MSKRTSARLAKSATGGGAGDAGGASAAPAATTTTTTTTTAVWSWAGDSGKGSQNVWIPFDAAVSALLEKGYLSGVHTVAVDKERFVDMKDQAHMGQRRFDAPDRVRKVKRELVATTVDKSGDPLWQWAGDASTGGSQNKWIDYSDAVALVLEAAFQAKTSTKIMVDKERYVDMTDITDLSQHRYDDPKGKIRAVRRLEGEDAKKERALQQGAGGGGGAGGGRGGKVAKASAGATAPIAAGAAAGGGGGSSTTTTTTSSSTTTPAAAAAAAGGGGAKMVTQVVKGKAPVDQKCPKASTHHVHYDAKNVYDAMLNQTNIGMNNNKFYIVQLLAPDAGHTGHHVWTRWGRVGQTGQSSLQPCSDYNEAYNLFCKKFQEKTGNAWEARDSFVKYGGKYALITRDYGTDDTSAGGGAAAGAGGGAAAASTTKIQVPDSKLASETQALVSMICNVEMFKQSMLEIGYDASRMPLGKLGKATIMQGYSALQDISAALNAKMSRGKLSELSSAFYTLIPHSFGMSLPPVIDSQAMLQQKLEMIAALSDAALATSLLQQQGAGGAVVNPVDAAHDKLNCNFIPLAHSDGDFSLVQRYVRDTHAPTHTQYKLEVLDVFRLERAGEGPRFAAKYGGLHNRQLLWHGSRLSNYVGIISQGLRIAPPEAPVTGYMFGKGVYFADMSSKSANYCATNSGNNVGLMLLCSVALGDTLDLKHADYNAGDMCKRQGKHSTFGLGKTGPDPSGCVVRADGTVVPCGKPSPTGVTDSSLLYNEFIVYDVDQVRVDFLVKLKFHYR